MPFGLGFFATAGAGAAAGAYELISTQVLSSSASSVTFSSIPQTYRHLQIRMVTRMSAGSGSDSFLRFNSDSSSNYGYHWLFGTVGDSTVYTAAGSNTTSIFTRGPVPTGWGSNIFTASVIDILDYANTSKNKTTRTFAGRIAAEVGAGSTDFQSGLWRSTSAITSFELSLGGLSFGANSRFSLYGIRG